MVSRWRCVSTTAFSLHEMSGQKKSLVDTFGLAYSVRPYAKIKLRKDCVDYDRSAIIIGPRIMTL
jgi:hypothetical protein